MRIHLACQGALRIVPLDREHAVSQPVSETDPFFSSFHSCARSESNLTPAGRGLHKEGFVSRNQGQAIGVGLIGNRSCATEC